MYANTFRKLASYTCYSLALNSTAKRQLHFGPADSTVNTRQFTNHCNYQKRCRLCYIEK